MAAPSMSEKARKRKLDENNALHRNDNVKECKSEALSFDGFQLKKIINDLALQKTIMVHGQCQDNQDAVVILEKKAFLESDVREILSGSTVLRQTLKNDIYHTYDCDISPSVNTVKGTLIYPATKRHIEKYTKHEPFVIQETAEDYQNITLPCLQSQAFSIQWVYNILEHKCESERIVYENQDPLNGFILLPDMKWNRTDMDSMYLVAICHRKGIKSIRELTQEHLPLLRNILQQGQEAIRTNFGIAAWKLRVYFHYQPSYNHLHAHFTHINFEAPGSGCERAHLLCDVIDNIESNGSYYQRKTLTYVLYENDQLFSEHKKVGRFDHVENE